MIINNYSAYDTSKGVAWYEMNCPIRNPSLKFWGRFCFFDRRPYPNPFPLMKSWNNRTACLGWSFQCGKWKVSSRVEFREVADERNIFFLSTVLCNRGMNRVVSNYAIEENFKRNIVVALISRAAQSHTTNVNFFGSSDLLPFEVNVFPGCRSLSYPLSTGAAMTI